MSEYITTYLLPKVKIGQVFALTVENEMKGIESRKSQYEEHMKEYADKGYELVSVSNLGAGMWFFWKK